MSNENNISDFHQNDCLIYNNNQQSHLSNLEGYNPCNYMNMSFIECLQGSFDYNTLSNAMDLTSCTSSQLEVEFVSPMDDDDTSCKKSSNFEEPAGEIMVGNQEDFSKGVKDLSLEPKGCENGDEKLNKVEKPTKKGDTKKREPQIAFMTKSEIDNLEDGYRWRKYGQKALKNSPFPRNYYRCTSQKCGVKKRVERSFEDPSVVITTYAGQHNHLSPPTLRINVAAPAMLSSPNFLSDFPQRLLNQNHLNSVYDHHHHQHLLPYQHLQPQYRGLWQGDNVPNHWG